MKYEKLVNGKKIFAECDEFTKNIYERLGYELVVETKPMEVKQAGKKTK